MIVECPRCLRRVLPKEDGTCPSCGIDPSDTSGTDPTRGVLLIFPGLKLPNVCFNCGMPASRQVAATYSNVTRQKWWGRWLLSRLIPFGNLLMSFEAAREDVEMTISLPVCSGCRAAKVRPVVQSYNLDDREAHVIVSKEFISACKTLKD